MTLQPPFANYQNEIYIEGLGGRRPQFPISITELEESAREKLSPEAYGYVAGAAGTEDTLRANLEAFRQWRLAPRMLRGAAQRDLSTEVLGTKLMAPVMLAPVGVQSIVHPDAEVAVARAAAETGLGLVLSTASSKSIEEVAEACGEAPHWFQLYWPNDAELAASFLKRAEAAGYSAIVLTLDTTLIGWRPRDLQHGYLPFLMAEGIANYLTDPVFKAALDESPEEDIQAAVMQWVSVATDPSINWDRLGFLRDNTNLPLLLKGILHPDDAAKAKQHGVDGVIVSNHGGRQIDGAVAALDALPRVVEAAGDLPVLFDSGIRTGSDVLKALALGARAVLLGRPYVWGLALGGQAGVKQVIRALLAELDLAMALAGCTSVDDIDAGILVREQDAVSAGATSPSP